MVSTWIITDDVKHNTLPLVVFSKFLKNIYFFPLFILYSLQASHQTKFTCNGKRGIKLYFLERGVSTKFIWNFCVRNCSHFSHIYLFNIYSIIYLYQYELVEICFTLCIIIKYYIVYYVAQIVPALLIRRYFRLAPVSLWYSLILLFSEHYSIFWAVPYFLTLQDVPGSFVYSLPQP